MIFALAYSMASVTTVSCSGSIGFTSTSAKSASLSCPRRTDLEKSLHRLPARRHSTVTRASADDSPPLPDWRSFRAKLIAQDASEQQATRRMSEDNFLLMKAQTPKLASEELWAHPTTVPERGGLLLATKRLTSVLGDEKLWQAVVLLVQHDEDGSIGFVLNRPTGLTMSSRLGGRPIEGAPTGIKEVFADSRLYCGGFTAQQVVHLMHGTPGLTGTVEVVPGIYLGGSSAAVQEVLEGRARPADYRFFAGCCAWEPGELVREVREGAWYTAACSRSVVLKQCLQLPVPLWREVLELMGGEYVGVARDAYDGGSGGGGQ